MLAQDPFNTRSAERVQEMTMLSLDNAGLSLEAQQRVDAWLATQPGQAQTEVGPDGRIHHISDVKNGKPDVLVTFNSNAAASIGTNRVQPGGSLGSNLTGSGVIVGVWDGGDVLTNHQEFFAGGVSRVIDKDGTSGLGLNFHAAHVTGTIAAAGVNTAARGMATASTVHSRYFNFPAVTMPRAAAEDGMKISNHSYGYERGWGTRVVGGVAYWAWYGDTAISQTEDYQYGFYSAYSREVDQICYAAKGYLPVWAAGNERGTSGQGPASQPIGHYAIQNGNWVTAFGVTRPNDFDGNGGNDLLADHALAKNNLTVAAVEDLTGGYNPGGAPSQVVMSSFSSLGPPDDGRVKPDVAANGVGLFSTDNDNTADYETLSGTSMAAPTVAGSTALFIERFTQHYGGADNLLSSTMKGVICHTADEAGPSPGPDYRFGWGLMNTARAISLLDEHKASGLRLKHIKQVVLPNNDFVEFTVRATGGVPLKVTSCWTDVPGTVPAAAVDADVAALVNDLDLRVGDGVTTYYPWKLNPAAPADAATRLGDNTRDNVEQVVIDAPVAGQAYTVRVTHKRTLQDATGATAPQMLSLVLSGIEDGPEVPFSVTSTVKVPGVDEYELTWNSTVGAVYQIETSTTLTPDWVTLPGSYSATKEIQTARVPVSPATEPKRFWRVKTLY